MIGDSFLLALDVDSIRAVRTAASRGYSEVCPCRKFLYTVVFQTISDTVIARRFAGDVKEARHALGLVLLHWAYYSVLALASSASARLLTR